MLKAGQKVRDKLLSPFSGGDNDDDGGGGQSSSFDDNNALYQTPLLTEKHDADVGGNSYVDRHGNPGGEPVKKQGGGGGGTSPLTLAGYAVAGVGAVVLLQSAMTLARVGAQAGGDKVHYISVQLRIGHRGDYFTNMENNHCVKVLSAALMMSSKPVPTTI